MLLATKHVLLANKHVLLALCALCAYPQIFGVIRTYFGKKHVVCSLTQKIEKSEGIWNLESQKFQQFQKFQCAHTMRALDIGMLSSSDTQVFGDL
jgi:hypothetical protein